MANGSASILSIANKLEANNPGQASKRNTCAKIEQIAVKEQRNDDSKPMWYIRDAFAHLLEADPSRQVRHRKDEREEDSKPRKDSVETENGENGDADQSGAVGPDGEIVPFPEYTGDEPPRESKKAFTHFCNGTRKEVKASLPPGERRDKVRITLLIVFGAQPLTAPFSAHCQCSSEGALVLHVGGRKSPMEKVGGMGFEAI